MHTKTLKNYLTEIFMGIGEFKSTLDEIFFRRIEHYKKWKKMWFLYTLIKKINQLQILR